MSSSRSIAGARNRRAGEPAQPPRPRPNTSIASQGAFLQQQYQQQQQQQQPQQQQVRQQHQQQARQQQNRKPAYDNSIPIQGNNNTKISISDAIGLITIRLGRMEQYLQGIQEKDDLSLSQSDNNLQLVDKDVIHNLTERIYTMENKKPDTILTNQITNQISSLEKEIKVLKQLLDSHIANMNVFISETDKNFNDVDNGFVELEKNIPSLFTINNKNIQLVVEEQVQIEEQVQVEEQDDAPTFSSIDLKNAIQEELANVDISN
jgi:type II secretory pathway pseudopilin PulG